MKSSDLNTNKEKAVEAVEAVDSEDMTLLQNRCPNLFLSFRQHYRRCRKRGAIWVPAPGGGYISDSSKEAFDIFLNTFEPEDRKALKKDIDTKPVPSYAAVTKSIARLLECMDEASVKKLLDDMQ